MEAAFGRLHNSGAGAFGASPTVVESIMVRLMVPYMVQYILRCMAQKRVPEIRG